MIYDFSKFSVGSDGSKHQKSKPSITLPLPVRHCERAVLVKLSLNISGIRNFRVASGGICDTTENPENQ